jgi:hypothetical protein
LTRPPELERVLSASQERRLVASKYDDLDPSTELEQVLAADLRAALETRGCEIVHHGANSGGRHSPGGKPDMEVRDHGNSRLILVEVTRRKASSADGEFNAVTDHLVRAVRAGGYADYGVLYVSPATSARMSASFRDLWNRSRERDDRLGRIVALDFEATEMMLTKLAGAPSDLYPASRFGDLFARWEEAEDDSLARLLVVKTLFPEEVGLVHELEEEVEEFAADRERRLKGHLERIEDALRDRGVTGDDANRVLIYLTFIRLYEERRQRRQGKRNRFTAEGFEKWRSDQPESVKNRYRDRMAEALLHEIAEDSDLRAASLLRDSDGNPHPLHHRVRDTFVVERLLPVFDQYDFHVGRVDVLGAVFETLARRAQKDTRVGQFFTPQPVVNFAAEIVPLTPRDVVLDPAVGTARFLIRAMRIMLDAAESPEEERAIRSARLLGTDIDSWVATIAKMNMYIHGDGKTNIREANGLVLSDRAVFGQFPEGLSGRVGAVLTNPPLGDTSHVVAVEDWGALADDPEADGLVLLDRLGVVPLRTVEEQKLIEAERRLVASEEEIVALESAPPDDANKKRLRSARRTRDRRADRVAALRAQVISGSVTREPVNKSMKGGALFLGAIADYLQPVRDPGALPEWRGGWGAVVVDEAILNTPEYGPVREFIRDRFYVKAVVSLGRQAFQYLAHASAKTSVLLVVRKPEPGKAQSEPIFYAHAERVGYGPTGSWVGDDLPQIRLLFEEVRRAVHERYQGAWLDDTQAQAAAEAVPGFGVSFYVMPAEAGMARLDFFNARYVQRTRELRERFGEPPILGDYLAVEEVERPEPNRLGKYPFAEINRLTGTVRPKGEQAVEYSPKSLWVVREGMLVVSGIDAVNGAVAVAGPDVDGLIMSAEMFAYRVKDPKVTSPVYLQLLVRSKAARELLEGLTTGTSNRTRLESAGQLLELPIPPLPAIEEQRRIAKGFQRSVAARTAATDSQAEAEDAVAGHWPEPPRPRLDMDERVSIDADPEEAMRALLTKPKRPVRSAARRPASGRKRG